MFRNKKVRKNKHKIYEPSPETTPTPAQTPTSKKKGLLSKLIRFFIWMMFFTMLCAGIGAYGAYRVYQDMSKGLPQISSLKDYRPPVITTVYSDDNRKIAEFYKERRIVRPFSEMPKMLINAFVAAEDSRFFIHKGVDIVSIIRAFLKNIEAGTVVQGGSTITQQVTKSFLLTPEKSYERKIREAILAYRIDKVFTKEEILYLYLNQIYMGHGAYGIEAAAQNYFGKTVTRLNLAECAMMAGLPQAPSKYSPFTHFEKAKERQAYVLNRMVIEGYITEAEAKKAISTPLDIKPRRNWYMEQVPYYTEHVRQYVEEKYGSDVLYNEGLQIYTAVNIDMQKAARKAVDKGLRALDKRRGYRGHVKHIAFNEMEAFSKKLQKELETDNETGELKKGMVVKGIVTAVSKNKTLTVSMGNDQGILSRTDWRWGRNHSIEAGDVIFVKIKEKIDAKDSAKNSTEDSEDEETEPEIEDEVLPDAGDNETISEQDNTDADSAPDTTEPVIGRILWKLALEQTPEVQGALLCIETETGHVKSMVGGRDFKASQFNRAIQSRRQPGSAFKPIIYAAALDKGYTPATEVIDNAIVYNVSSRQKQWKPKNYDRKFSGPILLRKALAKSRNTPTIQILNDIGISYVIDYAKKLGITSELGHNPSLALGTSGVSLLELVNAYAVFANMGEYIEPVFITKIVNRYGEVIEETEPHRERAIEKNTAYIMTSLLESVIKEGTGRKALALRRPAIAGKTGTTNDLRDAWFVGYTPEYIAGAWVGLDIERPLGKGESGSKAACPIWLDFMKQVLADKPVKHFKVPTGVVFSKIDSETGLLPIPETKKTLFECFKQGTAPTKYTKRPDAVADAEQFFKKDL